MTVTDGEIDWIMQYLEAETAPQAQRLREILPELESCCSPKVLQKLGYQTGRGKCSPATLRKLAERDRAIKDWQDSTGENSNQIAKKLSDFGSRTWPFCKNKSEMPERFCGDWKEFAWRVYRAKPSSLCARQIHRRLVS